MSRPRGNLALAWSREPEADIDVDISSAEVPQQKPCEVCGTGMTLTRVETGNATHLYYEHGEFRVCATCNHSVAQTADQRYNCVVCNPDISLK